MVEDGIVERETDAWVKPLRDGRVEMLLKAPGFRLRFSAPEDKAWEAVEMFERWTGLSVEAERRPARPPRVLAGQLCLTDDL